MKHATLISIAEYLRTSYSPDCDFVDGEVLERNWGERSHSGVQGNLVVYLARRAEALGIEVFPELRVQVSPTRIRVPDITVVQAPEPEEEIFTSPPHLCIEILSKHDTMIAMQEKIDDYLNFGVPYVWIVNPKIRKAYVVTRDGMVEAKNGVLDSEDPKIAVPLAALFEEL